MIPIFKLSKLPRSQKLRKAANLLRNRERALKFSPLLDEREKEYFSKLLEHLVNDNGNPPQIKAVLEKTLEEISDEQSSTELRRSINTVYHALLAETGIFQADWDFYDPDGTLDPSKRRSFTGMQVYLEDIRSPYNVGSMFRAAESFGAEKIWLSPLSASPRHKRAERTAMGCVDVIPWEQLKEELFPYALNTAHQSMPDTEPCFALETGGTPLEEFPFPEKGLLIAGSEELGVSPQALALADSSLGRVSIQTYGAKGSLNVSVAFGIVMQTWAAKLSE